MSRRRKAPRTLRSTTEIPGMQQEEPVESAKNMRFTDALGTLINLNQNTASLELHVLEQLAPALTTTLIVIRAELNSRRPALRIPPEILSIIFSFVPRRIRDLKYMWPQVVVECKDLVPVTEVCRYWRQVALDNPFLWSHIDYFTPEFMFERSRGAPLHVFVDPDTNIDLVERLMEDRRPFRAFYGGEVWSPSLKNCPGHELETLELITARNELVFEGNTPRLRELALFYTLPVNDFSNLLRLCLRFINDIPFSKLHSWLSASPRLQELILSNLKLDIDRENLKVVHLGHLRRLTVSDMSDDGAQRFFDYVTKSNSRKFEQLRLDRRSRLLAVGQSSSAYIRPRLSSGKGWYRMITQGINVDDIKRVWVSRMLRMDRSYILRSLFRDLATVDTLHVMDFESLDDICRVILRGRVVGSGMAPILPKLSCLRIMATAKEVDGSLLGRLVTQRALQKLPIEQVVLLEDADHGMLRASTLQEHVKSLTHEPRGSVGWSMEMPAICTDPRHSLWRSWN
ncbi:hypothetical protein OBBRIDRAFT_798193 [Obba rivulosa]|uniref:F-box domain-containing protein n=1 Tax=Obba rivulosa TaxID=1052685 RepID=A0A8E2AJN0_9APHY|nr:hypothetical protein OBBRIDRAFT_798193 [Obba rivulosa]